MKRYVKENICGVEAYSPVDKDDKIVLGVVLVTILPSDSKVVGEIKGWRKGEPVIEWYKMKGEGLNRRYNNKMLG